MFSATFIGTLFAYLSPYFFMVLYAVKSNKLNFLRPLSHIILLSSLCLFPLATMNIYFVLKPELMVFYAGMVWVAFHLFNRKMNPPQALSIAFCLTFFGSLYWEIPYHIFTTVYRGYVVQAFMLHILYIFPGLFVWTKISLKTDKTNWLLFISSMVISSLGLIFLYLIGADFYMMYNDIPSIQLTKEVVWFLSRVVCFTALYSMFYRGTIRKKVNQKQ